MNATEKAIHDLRKMQKQIICGNNIFGDIADLIEAKDQEITRLRELAKLAELAIGDHNPPGDCFSTGPRTGDPIKDYLFCPACAFIRTLKALTNPNNKTTEDGK